MVHPMLIKFRLRMMVAKKFILLKNSISSLMVIFLLVLIISMGAVI